MFDLAVNTGTALPFAKDKKQTNALALFDRGIIDDEEVLSQLDYPNKEKVLLRVNQKKAEMAQMQAQGNPPGGASAPPPSAPVQSPAA